MASALPPAEIRVTPADALRDRAPIRVPALGPTVNQQGYYVGRVRGNLYWITGRTCQSAFLTTSDGVVLFDGSQHRLQHPAGHRWIAVAKDVSNKVTCLIYSHHANHAGASSLFNRIIIRIGHEETRKATAPRRRPGEARTRAPAESQHDALSR